MWILVDTRDSVLGGDRGDMDIICRYGRYYRAREWIGYEPGMLSETSWRLNHSNLLYPRQVTSVMIFSIVYHDIKYIIMWFCERKVCENSFKKCHCRFCCRRKAGEGIYEPQIMTKIWSISQESVVSLLSTEFLCKIGKLQNKEKENCPRINY